MYVRNNSKHFKIFKTTKVPILIFSSTSYPHPQQKNTTNKST